MDSSCSSQSQILKTTENVLVENSFSSFSLSVFVTVFYSPFWWNAGVVLFADTTWCRSLWDRAVTNTKWWRRKNRSYTLTISRRRHNWPRIYTNSTKTTICMRNISSGNTRERLYPGFITHGFIADFALCYTTRTFRKRTIKTSTSGGEVMEYVSTELTRLTNGVYRIIFSKYYQPSVFNSFCINTPCASPAFDILPCHNIY